MAIATRDYSFVVGGAWAESESGARLEATSPATGESLDRFPDRGAADPELADQLVLVDRRAGRELEGQDTVANRDVGSVGEQRSGAGAVRSANSLGHAARSLRPR